MTSVSPTRVIGGRYVVLGELGRGGMGIVWRAEDRVMGRQVAVKELHLPQGLGPDDRLQFRERLLREARNAGRLNDPGIVTVHDVISEDGVDHIVMELIEARTLTEVVRADGPLDERSVPGLTTTGSVMGSPGYLAPERIEGGPATPASDLWALGATLFYAVYGEGPFSRETSAATLSAVLHADIPPVRARGPIGTVVGGLLQRSPEARLGGMQAAALLASENPSPMPLYGGETTTAPMPSPAARRRRWLWPVAALLVGLVLGVLGALLVRPSAPTVPVMTYGDGGDLPVFGVTSSSCIPGALAPGRSFPSSAYADCDAPHDLEVVGSLDPFGTSRELPYPGLEDLSGYARSACTLLFDSALVEGADKARLQVVGLVPTAAAFTAKTSSSFTTRDVICVLRAADGSQLTGSRMSKDPG